MNLKEVIIKPIITEKLMTATGLGQFSFQVSPSATKRQIVAAVKKYFKVDPIKVRTVRVKGKERRSMRTRRTAKLSDWKKAIVTLREGQKIDAFEVTE